MALLPYSSASGSSSIALSAITAATGANTITSGNNLQTWQWSLSSTTNGFTINENSASSGSGYLLSIGTIASSNAKPLQIQARGVDVLTVGATGTVTIGSTLAMSNQSITGVFAIQQNTSTNWSFSSTGVGAVATSFKVGTGNVFYALNSITSTSGPGIFVRSTQGATTAQTGILMSIGDTSVTTDAYSKAAVLFVGDGSGYAKGDMYFCLNTVSGSNNATSSDVMMMIDSSTARVGIGTITPTGKLSVGSSSQFYVTSGGAIGAATGITSSGTITFSGFTTNGGHLYTNGSGVLSQTGAGTSTQVMHGGTTPSFSAVSLTADVTGTLPVANGGTGITAFGTGMATWLGNPSSVNLLATMTDSTGSGVLVFAQNPAFTTTISVGATGGTTGIVNFKGATSGIVSLSVADAAGTWTMKLPTSGGTSGYVLSTDGSGNTSWITPPSITRSVTAIALNTNAGSTALTDYVYIASGTITVTLPTASGNSNLYTVKNSGSGVITVATTSSQTIDGSLTATLAAGFSITVVASGSSWYSI